MTKQETTTETEKETDGEPRVLALSLTQPWAWLIVNRHKTLENRVWHLPDRVKGQVVLIHAARKMARHDYDGCVEFLNARGLNIALPPREDLELGGIVGSARFTGCICDDHMAGMVAADDLRWRISGQHSFLVEDAQPLPFSPSRGMLNFYKHPPREPTRTPKEPPPTKPEKPRPPPPPPPPTFELRGGPSTFFETPEPPPWEAKLGWLRQDALTKGCSEADVRYLSQAIAVMWAKAARHRELNPHQGNVVDIRRNMPPEGEMNYLMQSAMTAGLFKTAEAMRALSDALVLAWTTAGTQ